MRQLGRIQPSEDERRPRAQVRGAALAPITEWHAPDGVEYRVFDNNRLRNCVTANFANLLAQAATCRGRHLEFTTQQVDDEYFRLTGGADSGLVETKFLADVEENGFCGVKVPLVHAIDPDLPDETLLCLCAEFGGLFVGSLLTASAMQQGARGQEWDLVDGNDPVVGGHAMLITDWWPDGSVCFGTYGIRQRATARFRRRHVDELYVVADRERLEEPGEADRLVDILGVSP